MQQILTTSTAINGVNWEGFKTLFYKEVLRFMKVWNQTIISPIITTLLFLAVFTLALGGGEHRQVDGVPFHNFIAPGLIMMAIVQNAFANTSSSLMISKIQGVIVDLLLPPLSPGEITTALVLGGIIRGLIVGLAVSLGVYVFVPFVVHSWGAVIFYTVAASCMMSLFGLVTGLWSQTFDQMAAMTNYVVTPLVFLSGTFYSIQQLPEFWRGVAHANPFFYMIDGFRYALTGHADGSIIAGIITLICVNIVLWIFSHWLIASGYRLKS